MKKHLTTLAMVLLCGAGTVSFSSCAGPYGPLGPGAGPPGPRSHYEWVPEYRNPDGVLIRGHWKYVGPSRSDREWIPGHYDRFGHWQDPRWRPVPRDPRGGGVWVPGRLGPRGLWIEGYWRY